MKHTIQIILTLSVLTLISSLSLAKNAVIVTTDKAQVIVTNQGPVGQEPQRPVINPQEQRIQENDRNLTNRIRNKINSTKGMSSLANNIDIISRNGQVTLSGNVKSSKEKSTINKIATKIAGKHNVDNQLEVRKKVQVIIHK